MHFCWFLSISITCLVSPSFYIIWQPNGKIFRTFPRKSVKIYIDKKFGNKKYIASQNTTPRTEREVWGAVLTALQYPFLLPKIGELRIFKFIVFIYVFITLLKSLLIHSADTSIFKPWLSPCPNHLHQLSHDCICSRDFFCLW